MENINELKVLLNYKQSEKKYLENQLLIVNQDLSKYSEQLDFELKVYVHRENREKFLLEHNHYKDGHVLNITSEWYYDSDWMKYKYGTKTPCDGHGKPLPYEGPDTLVWGICESCEISVNIPCKKEQDISDIVEREFENHILRKKQSEFKQKVMKNLL